MTQDRKINIILAKIKSPKRHSVKKKTCSQKCSQKRPRRESITYLRSSKLHIFAKITYLRKIITYVRTTSVLPTLTLCRFIPVSCYSCLFVVVVVVVDVTIDESAPC